MYQGTRIFASNLKEKMAQRFYNLVLLPRIRDDISEYKRLNFHLYQALRKALFKPGAFMKGIVIPLCEVSISTNSMYFYAFTYLQEPSKLENFFILAKLVPYLHILVESWSFFCSSIEIIGIYF